MSFITRKRITCCFVMILLMAGSLLYLTFNLSDYQTFDKIAEKKFRTYVSLSRTMRRTNPIKDIKPTTSFSGFFQTLDLDESAYSDYGYLTTSSGKMSVQDKKRLGESFNVFGEIDNTSKHVNPMIQWGLLKAEEFSPPVQLCPYMALHKNTSYLKSTEKQVCAPRELMQKDCLKSLEYYKDLSFNAKSCDSQNGYEFCKFKEKNRRTARDIIKVQCDVSPCGGKSLLVGFVNPETGKVSNESEWRKFETQTDLETILPDLLKDSSLHGYDFCFILCVNNEDKIVRQFLVFPPIIKIDSTEENQRININIIVEDSVARPHVFRAMPKTVQTLRDITYNPSIPASVLEFKLLQSYASYTYKNIQHLMAGTTYKGQKNYGIQRIFNHFKGKGYQTLFQEDSCWYDYYGTMIYPEYRDKLPTKKKMFEKIWKTFQMFLKEEEIKQGVDSLGLTISACKIYQDYGVSNQYRKVNKKFCWAGKHFSSYFLHYVMDLLRENRAVKNSSPVFLYTHLTTSHEPTGQRITNDDAGMSLFMRRMADESNTLTVFLSDHGSKTTQYSIKTSEGRAEVFDPFMFMIVPHALAQKLGRQKIRNLVLNQERLVTVLDLHHMLMSLNTDVETTNQGLLSLININRTCADLDLESEVLCKCAGGHARLSEDSKTVVWLSDIALGVLNNDIQSQHIAHAINVTHNQTVYGYGKCARYYGKRVERARQMVKDGYYITSFALIAGTAFGIESEEMFEITMKHPVPHKHSAELLSFVRISIYGRYKTCVDKGVNLHLCACSIKEPPLTYDVHHIMKMRHFDKKPEMTVLDHCLLLTKRHFIVKLRSHTQTWVTTYEVGNTCEDVVYWFKMSGKLILGRLSSKLPVEITLRPKSIHFVISTLLDWKYGRFKPRIIFKLLVNGTKYI